MTASFARLTQITSVQSHTTGTVCMHAVTSKKANTKATTRSMRRALSLRRTLLRTITVASIRLRLGKGSK